MKFVPIGRIISTQGIKGEIKFRYYSEEKEVFYTYASFFVNDDTGWRNLEPSDIKFRKGLFYVTFKGFSRHEDVSFLTNRELFVREEDLPRLREDEYYEYRLVGLDVINQDDEMLGKVSEIIHTGANDVLLLKGENEILIPMVEDYILEINLEKAFIRIRGDSLLV